MDKTVFRRRPQLNTTVAPETKDALERYASDAHLPHIGVAIDVIVAQHEKRLAACPDPAAGYEPDPCED